MTSDIHLTFKDLGPGGSGHIQRILNKWCPLQAGSVKCNSRVVLRLDPSSATAAQMRGELDSAGAVYSWAWVVHNENDLRPTIWERLEKMT